MENYHHGATSPSYQKNNDLKEIKQELTELLEEDAKADKQSTMIRSTIRNHEEKHGLTLLLFHCSKATFLDLAYEVY